jgi:HEAT repeat protein
VGWTLLCLFGLPIYLCSGLHLFFSGMEWLPALLLGGLWFYRLSWLLAETEVWHMSPNRLELRTNLFGLRGKRHSWKDARIWIKGPVDLDTELCVLTAPEEGRPDRVHDELRLHHTASLEDTLGLATLISESTGWPIEYTNLAAVFDQTLEHVVRCTDVNRLRLLLETRSLLPRIAAQLRTPRRNLLLAMMRESETHHPVLELALRDGHAAIRAAAIDLLAALEDRRALPAIRDVLEGADSALRARAADALGHLQDRDSVPALCEALRGRDTLPTSAARALGVIADPQSVPALCSVLQASPQEVGSETRWEAVMALGRIRHREAVPALCYALADTAPKVREGAAYALGQIGDPAAIPDLCRSLYDPIGPVAPRAAAALGFIRDESAVPALCGLMITGVTPTRFEVVGALARIGNDQAIQALCGALADPDSAVRRAAAAGIGTVVTQREHLPLQIRAAMPALKRLCSPLSTESTEVKRACRDTLNEIEARTGALKELPLPAAPGAPSLDTLPRPSDAAD